MIPIDRLSREFKISLEGLKRGLSEIAILMDENMQIVKLTLQISDLEKQMAETFLRLGRFVYEQKVPPQSSLVDHLQEDPEVHSLVAEIEMYRDKIQKIDADIEVFREDFLKERFTDLHKTLLKKGGSLDAVILPESSPWTGKQIRDIPLRPTVRLIAILRSEELIYPSGDTRLLPGDRITLMGATVDTAQALSDALRPGSHQPSTAGP